MTTTTPTSAPGDVRLGITGAVSVARACCPPGCFTYHAAWRLFRRTGLKGNPTWHTGFYATALAGHRPPTDRPVRVLICAASDETMLAVLSRLLRPCLVTVTLVDACRTPLLLAAAYARHHGIDLRTIHAHAPDLPHLGEPFDIVVTDGLLSLLPHPDDADALLGRLAAALDPTGILLYTTRIAGQSGILEYDRLGRVIQSVTAAAFWPGTAAQRRQLAHQARTRVARPNPFQNPADVQSAFSRHFTTVRMFTRTTPHSVALRLHPATYRGTSSISVGILATTPTTVTDASR